MLENEELVKEEWISSPKYAKFSQAKDFLWYHKVPYFNDLTIGSGGTPGHGKRHLMGKVCSGLVFHMLVAHG